MRAQLTALLLLVAVVGAVGSGEARAASIVFVKGNNVWLANPDGTGQRQVTRDGGPGTDAYFSPTQADDGEIFALRGDFVHQLNRNGGLVVAPYRSVIEATPALAQEPVSAEVSPDGRTLAVNVTLYGIGLDPACNCQRRRLIDNYVQYQRGNTDLGKTDQDTAGRFGVGLLFPSWIDNSRILVFSQFALFGPQAFTAAVGGPAAPFYEDPVLDPLGTGSHAFILGNGELTRAGDKLVALRTPVQGNDIDTNRTLQLYSATGVNAAPVPRCAIGPGRHFTAFPEPSWSPDGATLIWEEQDGTYTTPVDLAAANCGIAPRLLIPDGYWADVGPADLGPADRTKPRLVAFSVIRQGRNRVAAVRLSEPTVLSGKIERRVAGRFKLVRTLKPRPVQTGLRRVALGRLTPGRYRLQLTLLDSAKNRARVNRSFVIDR